MKIVKVLINLELNQLIQAFTDYLNDAGHIVFVNAHFIKSASNWIDKYTHNVFIINPEQLHQVDVDYVLQVSRKPSLVNHSVISLDFEIKKGQVKFFSILNKTDKQQLLINRSIVSPYPTKDPNFLSYLYLELNDLFIDTIIYLSKYGESGPVTQFKSPKENQFTLLHHYTSQDEELNKFYQKLQNRDDIFQMDYYSQSKSPSKTQQTCRLDLGENKHLELFTLYLLQLWNSRKEALYTYDLMETSKRITKYVYCYSNDDYDTLHNRYQDKRYNIINNKFYRVGGAAPAAILVSYNEIPSDITCDILIQYNEIQKQITISYPTHFYFFTQLPKIVEQFSLGLPLFIQGKLNLEQFQQFSAISWLSSEINSRAFPQSSLCQLFELQAQKSPNNIAVSCENDFLSYQTLNERANQLAAWISARQGVNEQLIVLYLDRKTDLIVALLAVLKSGNAYVPLDFKYPSERILSIIEDCKPALVVTHTCYYKKLLEITQSVPILALDTAEAQAQLRTLSNKNLSRSYDINHLAYVIYTSGTTGKPKGVMIEQKSLVNTLTYFAEVVNMTSTDKLLAVTTIAFDIAGLELYLPLICGGEVVLASQQMIVDIPRLLQIINDKKITIMQATPSLWHLVNQALKDKTLAIRALCGGEALNEVLATHLMQKVQCLWNVYGPTETTIWSTINLCANNSNPSFIGKPIANTECFVLDESLLPLPRGVIGELYIAGAGLARGYFCREELTAQRFCYHPLLKARLYKTGDLVRSTLDGNLEFIGRNDFQVKIRGHRIELGDIESTMNEFDSVQHSVVVAKMGNENTPSLQNNQYLVGYYVAHLVIDEVALHNHLINKLPDYMVPNILVALKKMPLNVNGKIDRNALPIPNFSSTTLIAPRNALESKLSLVWGEILGLTADKIDVFADFFHLGGNSILAIQLVNKINQTLNSDIAIRDVFIEKTIAKLAYRVEQSIGHFLYKDFQLHNPSNNNLYELFPLSNVQQTYYWGRLDHFELSNISTHVYTEFKYQQLNVERLQSAFNKLIERHLALRTIFIDDQQCFLKQVEPYTIHYFELTSYSELLAIRQQYSHKVYAADCYPLFDIIVTRYQDFYLLHLSFDAIIIDMSSFKILFTEWITLYNQPLHQLPALQINFRDYMLQVEKLRKSTLFAQAKTYWQQRLDDYYLEMNLPLIAHPSQIKYPHFKRITKTISKSTWEMLTTKAHHIGISPTVLVLEAYAHTLCFWSGQQQLAINLTLFNRLPLHAQVNNLIGDFTALELFAYRANSHESISSLFKKTHHQLMTDIENNLFDGIDFQRMLRQHHAIHANSILSPVVLTSVLGGTDQNSLFHLPIDASYQGIYYAISQTSQVWLDNKAYETHEGFVAEWDYVEQLFAPEAIQAMHNSYCEFIEALAVLDWEKESIPPIDLPASHLELINRTNRSTQPQSEATLVSAYAHALTEPGCNERIAVIDSSKNKAYSHMQLGLDSDGLAAHIVASANQGRLVAVLSEKGYNQVVATLSIMKAGYAYLPLHVDWPWGRINEVLTQGGVELILLSQKHANDTELYRALSSQFKVLVIEDALENPISFDKKPTIKADDVAYVIFTSGSTGKPKGVTISHRGALNTLIAVNTRFSVCPNDKVLALSELSFDLSVYDIFGLLIAGGTIVFPEQELTKDPQHWLSLIHTHQITIWNTVPQLAGLLLDEIEATLPFLRVFLLSGDWIPVSLPDRLKTRCQEATIMSLGGATEGSIWSIWYPIEKTNPNWNSIPYGQAMPNQTMYVLNSDGAHCPIGVIGEIHIGGIGLALNYWGDDVITQRQFFTHPKFGRLYRTGDLGRWHPDGYMEFAGRNDFQVKINGYRVELDEIASKIELLKGIEKAVVSIQKQAQRTHLVAYLLPQKPLIPDNFDKELFKLEQHGLINNLPLSYQLIKPILHPFPNQRKSYRNFIDLPLDSKKIQPICEASLLPKDIHHAPEPVDLDTLMTTLATIAGQIVPNKVLPKYQYPSGGSTYAIRCFVSCPEALGDLKPGVFYYHPVNQALYATETFPSTPDLSLSFTVHWPAITPIYGDLSKKLVFIELGHMLHLITSALLAKGVNYALTIEDRVLDSENHVLAQLKLPTAKVAFPQNNIKLAYLYNQNNHYVNETQESIISLANTSVFTQSTEFGQLLQEAKLMITIEGDESWQNYLMSGYTFQAISQSLLIHGIGSCSLGFTPYKEALYAMVIGYIDAKEIEKPESVSTPISLHQVINRQLSKTLPDYMLPHAYALLDNLPLSANGKLAKNLLPDLIIDREYQSPATEFETHIATIWAQVLSLPQHSISRTDNFFTLGGNSLLAMQLIRQLNRELKLPMKLSDLYQHSTISHIAENFSPLLVLREEGVI